MQQRNADSHNYGNSSPAQERQRIDGYKKYNNTAGRNYNYSDSSSKKYDNNRNYNSSKSIQKKMSKESGNYKNQVKNGKNQEQNSRNSNRDKIKRKNEKR
jgi:hypothetical protein